MNDQGLEELGQLEAHVRSRLGRRVHELRLLLRDEGIVLQGYSHTYFAKQIAQHAVMEASRLPIRANDIEVC